MNSLDQLCIGPVCLTSDDLKQLKTIIGADDDAYVSKATLASEMSTQASSFDGKLSDQKTKLTQKITAVSDRVTTAQSAIDEVEEHYVSYDDPLRVTAKCSDDEGRCKSLHFRQDHKDTAMFAGNMNNWGLKKIDDAQRSNKIVLRRAP